MQGFYSSTLYNTGNSNALQCLTVTELKERTKGHLFAHIWTAMLLCSSITIKFLNVKQEVGTLLLLTGRLLLLLSPYSLNTCKNI